MQNVPLEAAHLFDLNPAILGWLLAAVQPEKAASAAQCQKQLNPSGDPVPLMFLLEQKECGEGEQRGPLLLVEYSKV